MSTANPRGTTGLVCGLLTLLAAGYLAACGGDSMTEPESAQESAQESACRVGQELDPGESCSLGKSTRFEVLSDGFGCHIQADQGEEHWECGNDDVSVGSFSASLIPDTKRWRIDSLP